jgi:Domain of unknown function (DUF1851)
MNTMLVISPRREAIEQALRSWQWLPISGREPILVTAFGSIFFSGQDGIWFLDTLEGTLQRVCSSRAELDQLLDTKEGQERYCLASFVERACREGRILGESQCYDFSVHPLLGGKREYENIQPTDFVVALQIAGLLHEQVKQLPPGTRITNE